MKPALLFFSLLLLSVSLASAISVDIKDTYKPRETILVKISGNFLEPTITQNNIFFYSGRQLVALEFSIGKIDESFYLYAVLPNIERNYTFIIKNAHYFEAGLEKRQDIIYNFTVQGNVSELTAKPGFVISDKAFSLTLESNTGKISAQIKYGTFSSSVELLPGIPKTVAIPLMYSQNITFLEVTSPLSSYKFPVKSLTYAREKQELAFVDTLYNYSIIRGSKSVVTLLLQNKGSESIKNIEISSGKDLNITPTKIESLEPNSVAELTLSLASADTRDGFTDKITAEGDGASAEVDLIVNVISFYIGNFTEAEKAKKSCREFTDGDICIKGEICQGNTENSSEGKCCIGTCKTQLSYGKTIVIILIIAALGAGAYYIFKLTRKKPQKNVLKEVEQRYTEKFKEVRGSLTKT